MAAPREGDVEQLMPTSPGRLPVRSRAGRERKAERFAMCPGVGSVLGNLEVQCLLEHGFPGDPWVFPVL